MQLPLPSQTPLKPLACVQNFAGVAVTQAPWLVPQTSVMALHTPAVLAHWPGGHTACKRTGGLLDILGRQAQVSTVRHTSRTETLCKSASLFLSAFPPCTGASSLPPDIHQRLDHNALISR